MTEPSWFLVLVVVLSAFSWLSAAATLVSWSLIYGIDAARRNRRLRLDPGLPASAHQTRLSLFAQLGLAGVVVALASFLINVGSAYYTYTGRFIWVASLAPFLFIGGAILLIEFSAIILSIWLSKKSEDDWLQNPSTLSATMTKATLAGDINSARLAVFEHSYEQCLTHSLKISPYTQSGLEKLNLWSPLSQHEWQTDTDHDPVSWAGRIRETLSWAKAARWLVRRHWRTLTFASVCIVPPAATLFIPLPPEWTPLRYGMALAIAALLLLLPGPIVIVARSDLVLANRLAAQQQKFLQICRQQLDDLIISSRPIEPGSAPMRRVFSFGSWRLYRAVREHGQHAMTAVSRPSKRPPCHGDHKSDPDARRPNRTVHKALNPPC